jgi:hypothetical protein
VITSDTVGPYVTAVVTGMGSGRYTANWLLTDSHGDTVAYSNPFAVQDIPAGPRGPAGPQGPTGATGATGTQGPAGADGAQGPAGAQGPEGAIGAQGPAGANGAQGPAGANGAQGPAGMQGPAGEDGKSSEVKCVLRTTGAGKYQQTHEICTVYGLSPGSHLVSVEISSGKKPYATGTAVVHARTARFTLRSLHPMRHGRYLITLVATHGKKSTVTRYRQTI